MANVATRMQNPALRSTLGDFLGFDPFRNYFTGVAATSGVEITRNENGYNVELPVAGYAPDQIDITLEDQVLTVTGKSDKRQFSRSLLLPEDIDADTIDAKVEHGMLQLTLNVHAKAKPRKISISQV